MGFRRFASRSRVLFVNSDFFLISGFTMKLGALLLCLCIVASQGRVLREKRETEEGLVDVAAEQENDTAEKKDEGFTNDSQEDVKARGAAFSKLVKTIVKNIPDGAVQKVKDAAVELVKGTVKKHLGMEKGDSLPEEPPKDIVVETDEEAGNMDEGMNSIPDETIVETDEVSGDSDEDNDVEEEEIVIIVKNIPKGAVQKVKDAAAELVKGTVKKHLGLEEGDNLTEEPSKDIVVETGEEAVDTDTVEESDNDNNVSGVIEIKIIVKNIPKGTVQKIKDEAVDLVNGTVKKHLGLEEGDSVPEEPKKQKRDTNEDEEEEEDEEEVKQKRDAGENEEEDEDDDEEEVKQKQKRDADEESDGKDNLSDLVGTIIDKIPEDTFEKVKEGLGNIPAIQVKEKVKEGLDSLPLDNVKETIKNLATNIEDSIQNLTDKINNFKLDDLKELAKEIPEGLSVGDGLQAIVNQVPKEVLENEKLNVGIICTCLFLCGLVFVTPGSIYVFELFNNYAVSGIALLWLVTWQSIGVGWVFGSDRYYKAIKDMIGYYPNGYIGLCYRYATPLLTSGVLLFYLINYQPLKVHDYVFPAWANGFGWILCMCSFLCVPGVALYEVLKREGSLIERFQDACQSTMAVPGDGKFITQRQQIEMISFTTNNLQEDKLRLKMAMET